MSVIIFNFQRSNFRKKWCNNKKRFIEPIVEQTKKIQILYSVWSICSSPEQRRTTTKKWKKTRIVWGPTQKLFQKLQKLQPSIYGNITLQFSSSGMITTMRFESMFLIGSQFVVISFVAFFVDWNYFGYLPLIGVFACTDWWSVERN